VGRQGLSISKYFAEEIYLAPALCVDGDASAVKLSANASAIV
jgi:hypothetical protein